MSSPAKTPPHEPARVVGGRRLSNPTHKSSNDDGATAQANITSALDGNVNNQALLAQQGPEHDRDADKEKIKVKKRKKEKEKSF